MTSPSIAIIDSGGANIASLMYAFRRLGADAKLTTDADSIRNAERVVLPGVGAARDAMVRLGELGLVDVIRGLSQPVLGICLGMQLLAEASEEEDVECLGIIPGVARKLYGGTHCPVPNMGWCAITAQQDHGAEWLAVTGRRERVLTDREGITVNEVEIAAVSDRARVL